MLDDEWRRKLCMVGLDKRYNSFHGKESTKVRIAQNMGKESENSYQKLKRSGTQKHMETYRNISKSFRVFLCACPTVISSIFGKKFHI